MQPPGRRQGAMARGSHRPLYYRFMTRASRHKRRLEVPLVAGGWLLGVGSRAVRAQASFGIREGSVRMKRAPRDELFSAHTLPPCATAVSADEKMGQVSG